MYNPYLMLWVLDTCRHRRLQIRKQAPQSRRRSSAKGLLCLLCATTAKSISKVKPSNKRGAHQVTYSVREMCRFYGQQAI